MTSTETGETEIVTSESHHQTQTTGPYFYRHKGTFFLLYLFIGLIFLAGLAISIAVVAADVVGPWQVFGGLLHGTLWSIVFIAVSMSCRDLEIRDDNVNNQLIMKMTGPCPMCWCGYEQTTVRYSDIAYARKLKPSCCLYCAKTVSIVKEAQIKFMHSGGICDFQCCDGCCRNGQPVDYEFYEIDLRVGRCCYSRVSVTTQDADGLSRLLESKGVNVKTGYGTLCGCC